MKINGVEIEKTFAEAFPMKATRLIITGLTDKWAYAAANHMTGFASSVIACGCEAGIEKQLKPSETPDGRPGYSVLIFAMSKKQLQDQLTKRVGQSVMTCATSACYAGTKSEKPLAIGKSLRFFGDGYQISKKIGDTRYWRIPVMHGDFVCEDTTGMVPAVGGGNFLILAKNAEVGLLACERALKAMDKITDVVTTFPGGVVGSGSKVGSKYSYLPASTNQAYCPTLKGQVDSALDERVGSVLEIVLDGISEEATAEAMAVGIRAACTVGAKKGIYRISAGNYGGKLGPYHFHLREVLKK